MNVFSDLKLNNKTSVYLQIIQHVKRKILNKSIIAYTPLPSRRELASLLSINPNTVQKSYKLMEEEGILRTISNVKSVVIVNEETLEKLRNEMIEVTMKKFVKECQTSGLDFQQTIAWLTKLWNT